MGYMLSQVGAEDDCVLLLANLSLSLQAIWQS